jgi:uncharacterized membrane protein
MLKLLKKQNLYKESLFLGLLTLMCFGLSFFRFLYTETELFVSLNWNLFLAFIPWALSSFAIINPKLQNNKFWIFILFSVWLLFFPNAPYILTDLFHLRAESTMPLWFDLILILSFAWTGMLFGFFSLWKIEQILEKSINRTWIIIISTVLLFLGSFGVYLGRYLRWNSWDIISEPFSLFFDIKTRLINPIEYPRTWGMTILMGIFLNMIYWTFRLIKTKD